ncbi:2-amino-4-hydroxy-6-hydroxymethyldihydropteridine diphosphokinase [Ectothiorhodospira mobilis]|uniref:2-amino-4-hydroxy-6- hydroxymethyldihydropteridine diphosphokinase n=1 Tax=Ectothiorhodospira mobilis TaxID=195064 RepID=UPI001903636B|nr:2-amino-4-hydroxy-6-hydroxymethyldihydropteridine diphosphokinase [Ectothiorhodospira mobilis]MBK1692660.1 2-amino-4-hydroxy-6-hydroxymethyldihydropteridine diphosphokinase [Ectothiorhodospira mobilis]
MTPETAFIGIGANLDDPASQVRRGLEALRGLPRSRLMRASSLYRNPPMGPRDQPDYVNAVCALETRLPPEGLLQALQAVEARHGRRRDGTRWGPRTLDLDLLLYGDRVLHTPRLTVPHPGIAQRAFVLHPLAEIAPELEIPGLGPLPPLLRACPGDGLKPLP